jgi:hypothetical protein
MTSVHETDDYRRSYEAVLPLLLDDHTRDFASDPRLFHDTFFDRGHEAIRFRELLRERDRTILITGNAGIGKTSFIYQMAFTPDDAGTAILPILADYRTAVPQDRDGCLLAFISNAIEQFATTGYPIQTVQSNTRDCIFLNLNIILEHLNKLDPSSSFPRVVLFLDDFDYAEDEWYYLLDYFLPFTRNRNCVVVLTVRPRLYATLQSYDDRLRFHFGRNVEQVKLAPMPAREVLASRLAPILLVRESQSVLASIINRFKLSHGPLDMLARQLGLTRLRDLQGMDFPFTDKHTDFMHRVTNGNLREILRIAMDSLFFVLDYGESLEARVENKLTRKVIGRENTLRLFYDNPNARYKLINVNQHRSAGGNSLLYNVLEAVKIHPEIDDRFFRLLRPCGHKDKDVLWAIGYLSDRSQRFIEEKWIAQKARRKVLIRSDEYEITEKGDYFLEIAKWPEYQLRAGAFGVSLLSDSSLAC